MHKTIVDDNITFAYHDNGAPPDNLKDYLTMVIIHGHTYHSGTFLPMLASGRPLGHRVVVPNRRLYPGSTPYTEEEIIALQPPNSIEELTKAVEKQGEYLLMFVDNVIQELGLKKVVLVGWSLGTAFLNMTIGAIIRVSEHRRVRLCEHVKAVVFHDPPASVHGIDDPPSGGWLPLYDETLPLEQRGPAFGQWLVDYYQHPDLASRDCYKLIYKVKTPVKSPTFKDTPFEELLTKMDVTAGPGGDNPIGDLHFRPVTRILREKAFFDLAVRNAWGNVPFTVIYGEESPYNVLWAAWQLEAESKKTGIPLGMKGMPGANHFAMNDHPDLLLATIQSCL
ncbi:Alpha/Beta hydrolase protein [Flammula alnicola]|nr:Alpha/Beta hydrolase protein [Flammula alnicola]